MSNAMYPTSVVTLENGEKHEVTPSNADMCRLEIVGAKENISLKDTPITALTFTAWAYLKRTGTYSGTWAEFRDRDCVELDPQDDDEERDELDEELDPKS